jgi:carboxylesterase type B
VLISQAQYVSAARSEVWVNIGYRLSAFGFLACDEPKISGNFGFKDQWLALEYIKANISAFGGAISPSVFVDYSSVIDMISNRRKPG